MTMQRDDQVHGPLSPFRGMTQAEVNQLEAALNRGGAGGQPINPQQAMQDLTPLIDSAIEAWNKDARNKNNQIGVATRFVTQLMQQDPNTWTPAQQKVMETVEKAWTKANEQPNFFQRATDKLSELFNPFDDRNVASIGPIAVKWPLAALGAAIATGGLAAGAAGLGGGLPTATGATGALMTAVPQAARTAAPAVAKGAAMGAGAGAGAETLRQAFLEDGFSPQQIGGAALGGAVTGGGAGALGRGPVTQGVVGTIGGLTGSQFADPNRGAAPTTTPTPGATPGATTPAGETPGAATPDGMPTPGDDRTFGTGAGEERQQVERIFDPESGEFLGRIIRFRTPEGLWDESFLPAGTSQAEARAFATEQEESRRAFEREMAGLQQEFQRQQFEMQQTLQRQLGVIPLLSQLMQIQSSPASNLRFGAAQARGGGDMLSQLLGELGLGGAMGGSPSEFTAGGDFAQMFGLQPGQTFNLGSDPMQLRTNPNLGQLSGMGREEMEEMDALSEILFGQRFSDIERTARQLAPPGGVRQPIGVISRR